MYFSLSRVNFFFSKLLYPPHSRIYTALLRDAARETMLQKTTSSYTLTETNKRAMREPTDLPKTRANRFPPDNKQAIQPCSNKQLRHTLANFCLLCRTSDNQYIAFSTFSIDEKHSRAIVLQIIPTNILMMPSQCRRAISISIVCCVPCINWGKRILVKHISIQNYDPQMLSK